MAPLNLERLNPQTKNWESFSVVKRGTVAGPIQSFLPDGSNELYFFHCNGNNSLGTIYKSTAEAKKKHARKHATLEVSPLTPYKELRKGEIVEIQVKQSLRTKPQTIRLTLS